MHISFPRHFHFNPGLSVLFSASMLGKHNLFRAEDFVNYTSYLFTFCIRLCQVYCSWTRVQNCNLLLHTAQLLDSFHRKYYTDGIYTWMENTGRILTENRYRSDIKETERVNVNWVQLDWDRIGEEIL